MICNTRLGSDDFVTCKKGKLALYELRNCSASSPFSNTIVATISPLLKGLRGALSGVIYKPPDAKSGFGVREQKE